MDRQFGIFMVIAIYMVIMIGIGFYYARRNTTVSDYVLGGRSLGPWVTALSAQASDMSGWLLTGLPGLAYLSLAGFKEATWTAIGLAIGTFLNWVLVARRLRSFTEVSQNSLTLPDYLQNRFRDKTSILKTATAIASIIFFLIYTSSMFVAGAKLFSTIFPISYTQGLLVISLIIISYTFLGGFLAVCTTDAIQGTLMFIALVFVPGAIVFAAGGFSASVAQMNPANWQLFPNGDGSCTWLLIASSLAWGLGYFGQPHILVRFMAIEKPKDIKPATIVAMVWVIITLFAAVMVGPLGHIFLAEPLAPGQHETIFMVLINSMFGPILTGVFLSAILAAIMSTAASQLLVASSALSNDIYKGLFRKKASENEVMLMSRGAVLLISFIALFLGMDPNSSIFGIVSYAWAGLGASFGPAVFMSLYWKRMTRNGAIAGVIVGASSTIIFNWLKTNVGGIFSVYELLPAFILAIVAIVVFSLLDKEPSKEMNDEFDTAVKMSKEK